MRSILLISVFTCLSFTLFSQRTCVINEPVASASVMSENEAGSVAPDVIIIPVVVHIVYNNADQNISNDQVRSQITVLNQDYRKKNADASHIPASFKSLAADTRIEFRLATVDPSGFATEGIVRKNTSAAGFTVDDKIKSSVSGGDDPWDRNQYLNIWVGNISGGVMGYSSSPACDPEKDGVVIRYTAFGTTPNVSAPFNKGRTTVHEVGHWLGLRHIWGDASCGDDKISDTPPQQGPTRGCPSGVVVTCASGAAGNMYMNFMDFTNDECTNMFTLGQAAKMRELFNGGGARVALLSSDKAKGASDEELWAEGSIPATGISAYPNPAVNELNIRFNDIQSAGQHVVIYNHLGQVAKKIAITKNYMQVNVSDLKSGMYFISTGGKKATKFIKG